MNPACSYALLLLTTLLLRCSLAAAGDAQTAEADSAHAPFIGGWHYDPQADPEKKPGRTEEDERDLGMWIRFSPDGTWKSVHDNMGLRVDRTGRWEAVDGNARRIGDDDAENFQREGDHLVQARGEWKWSPYVAAEEMPGPLAELPPVPRSLEEAIALLKRELPEEDKDYLASMAEGDLIQLHFGFGMGLRNRFGLWGGNPELLKSCGSAEMHPDDASMVIIETLWRRLREDRPELRHMEELLSIPVKPFPTRNMTAPEFLAALNRNFQAALKEAGHPAGSIQFSMEDEDAKKPERASERRVSHMPCLKAWGIKRGENLVPKPPLDLVPGMRALLRPPHTVELQPRGWNGGLGSPDESPVWEEIYWQGDSFDLEIRTTDSGFANIPLPGIYRKATWEMHGATPQMSIADALKIVLEHKTRVEGERLTLVELSQYHLPMPPSGAAEGEQDDVIWTYRIECLTKSTRAGDAAPEQISEDYYNLNGANWKWTLIVDDLDEKSEWADFSKEPHLTPIQAMTAANAFLKKDREIDVPLSSMTASLIRIGATNKCYYKITANGLVDTPFSSLTACVKLDGEVVPYDRNSAD